ncbi:hypothetical protein CCACVL1_31021 [Corchorus capsularis]|uniref:Uncharacterized protein n=1 Tax=Corchorus capsularis TaxID=210143 RepID=A0A1R3FU72_COCAP|nr:hypothetical protein CCACVL1_31021 [Corchorus capsularis]
MTQHKSVATLQQEAPMMKVAQANTMPSEHLDPSTWQADLDQLATQVTSSTPT